MLPFVSVLEPASAEATVNVPLLVVAALIVKLGAVNVALLVVVPLMVTYGIVVTVAPLIVLAVPEKVCVALELFWAVNVVALFVKLPPKMKAATAPVVVSFHTAPLLSVTSPVKVMVRLVVLVEPKFIVPDIAVAPVTVKSRCTVTVPPVLIVSAPNETVVELVVALSVPPLLIVTDPV